jgi:hypothetical protein
MKFHDPALRSTSEAKVLIESDSAEVVCEGIVTLVSGGEDWLEAQEVCLKATRHSDIRVRRVSVTCLGHVARLHGRLDLDRVLPTLDEMRSVPELTGAVDDALDDIRRYVVAEVSLR